MSSTNNIPNLDNPTPHTQNLDNPSKNTPILQYNRKYIAGRARIYFAYLTDEDIQGIIQACGEELELRSQEQIRIGDD